MNPDLVMPPLLEGVRIEIFTQMNHSEVTNHY
jgi:hypothetical protein